MSLGSLEPNLGVDSTTTIRIKKKTSSYTKAFLGAVLAVGLPAAATIGYVSRKAENAREEVQILQDQVKRLVAENDALRKDKNIKQGHIEVAIEVLGKEHGKVESCENLLNQTQQAVNQCLQALEQNKIDLARCNQELTQCDPYRTFK